jgi:hypothetical protein
VEAVTVAVKVTDWFNSDGLTEEARATFANGETVGPLTWKLSPTGDYASRV